MAGGSEVLDGAEALERPELPELPPNLANSEVRRGARVLVLRLCRRSGQSQSDFVALQT